MRRYWLAAYVVMDDHVHVIVRPAGDRRLEAIVHTWKSYTANQMQRVFARQGAVWQDESYDRIIRDGREFDETLAYLGNNPQRRWPEVEHYPWLRVYPPG
jgi:REP element-mobilizing transposase RayT